MTIDQLQKVSYDQQRSLKTFIVYDIDMIPLVTLSHIFTLLIKLPTYEPLIINLNGNIFLPLHKSNVFCGRVTLNKTISPFPTELQQRYGVPSKADFVTTV